MIHFVKLLPVIVLLASCGPSPVPGHSNPVPTPPNPTTINSSEHRGTVREVEAATSRVDYATAVVGSNIDAAGVTNVKLSEAALRAYERGIKAGDADAAELQALVSRMSVDLNALRNAYAKLRKEADTLKVSTGKLTRTNDQLEQQISKNRSETEVLKQHVLTLEALKLSAERKLAGLGKALDKAEKKAASSTVYRNIIWFIVGVVVLSALAKSLIPGGWLRR